MEAMMTSINDKLGIKRAGKRSMMKLPKTRAAATALTSAKCPTCGRTGARQSQLKPGYLVCSWCADSWEPAPSI